MNHVNEPALQAARRVARRVEAHFADRIDAAMREGTVEIGPKPDAATVEALIEVAFWASLRREEGRVPRISLAFVPPEQVQVPLLFERLLPLTPEVLTRLAPAVEHPGVHLGVWRTADSMAVWGATHTIPPLCFVLETVAPGLLVVKYRRREDAAKYVNVVVLDADRIKVLAGRDALSDCPEMVSSLRGFDAPGSFDESVNVLVQLALSMRGHGHGGTLLVVAPGTDAWQESVVRPIPYAVAPPFAGLAERVRHAQPAAREGVLQALYRQVDGIAGLTAVDGATILTDTYDLLAFGAKIMRKGGSPQVEQVMLTEPIEDTTPEIVHPSDLGGTRHLSAAQFVHDQRSALALVASQDGRFTIFAWSACQGIVHAHRVETLLL